MRRPARLAILLCLWAIHAGIGAAADPPVTRELRVGDLRAEVDLSPQVLKLTASPLPEVYERPPSAFPGAGGTFLPASVLITKAKQFDDGLLAAVDLAAQTGLGNVQGRRDFLRDLENRLTASRKVPHDVRGIVGAARHFSEPAYEPPASWAHDTRSRLTLHEHAPWSDPPHGYYTWSDALRDVFSCRRVLQTTLEQADAEYVGAAIDADGTLAAHYRALLALDARVWNAPDRRDVTRTRGAPPRSEYSLFPGGRSLEVRVTREKYRAASPPPDFDPLNEIVARVRAGTLSLEPVADSGWYEWQSWALAPLLRPESSPESVKLSMDGDYRELLAEQFRGAYVQARESFTGGVPGGVPGGLEGSPLRPIHIFTVAPDLTLEPLPEFYGRRARAYEFIERVLGETFGDDAVRLRRVLPDGSSAAVPLLDELKSMIALFRGAAALSRRQIGLAVPDPGVEQDIEGFVRWNRDRASDPDVARDVRAMVPVFYDALHTRTLVWMFLGWHEHRVILDFSSRPAVTVRGPDGQPADPAGYEVRFRPQVVSVLRPVVATAYVSKVLDREAFQRLCDTHRTTEAILANLK